MRPEPVPDAAGADDPLLTDSEAVLYLGFRGKADLLQRVADGRLVPAGKRKGRYRFRLGELRRYSRGTARPTAEAEGSPGPPPPRTTTSRPTWRTGCGRVPAGWG